MAAPFNRVGLIRRNCEVREVVIAASPTPIITCQKNIAGTVTVTPPTGANIEETPICVAVANAPNTMENHDATKTLTANRF